MTDKAVPPEDDQIEKHSDATKQTKKRKRRGTKSFTHFKSGSKGGRPRRSNDFNSINVSNAGVDISDRADQSPKSGSDAINFGSVNSTTSSTGTLLTEGSQELDTISDTGNVQLTSSSTSNSAVKTQPEVNQFSESLCVNDKLESVRVHCPTDTAGYQSEVVETPESPFASDTLESTRSHTSHNIAECCPQVNQTNQENQASCQSHLSTQVIVDVLAELSRRIFLPWIIVPEEGGINVLLLSRDQARTTQRRVFFSFSGKEELSIHCKEVPETIAKDILDKGDKASNIVLNEASKGEFVDRVVTVIKRVCIYEVCVGIDNLQYKPLWEIDKNGEIDNNPYHEARYRQTFRPFDCEMLVSIQKYFKHRCSTCIKTKIRFRNKLPNHSEKVAPSTTANVHLDRNQLVGKVERLQKDLKYARAQIAKLKAERDGVHIGEE